MENVHLTAEVTLLSDDPQTAPAKTIARREYSVSVRDADAARAWVLSKSKPALRDASPREVVRATITGRSRDGSHHLATGSVSGWLGRVQKAEGVFDR